MGYKIRYKNSVFRDLKRIGSADARRIMDNIDSDLVENPGDHPMLKGRYAGLRKYRIDNCRVIYSLIDDVVLILRIGHRRDIYK